MKIISQDFTPSNVFRKYIGNITNYVQILPKFHAFNSGYHDNKVKVRAVTLLNLAAIPKLFFIQEERLISLRVLPHFQTQVRCCKAQKASKPLLYLDPTKYWDSQCEFAHPSQ